MRLRAIRLIVTLALGVLAVPLAASAQQAGKLARIGYLGNTSLTPQTLHLLEAFRKGLRELGYTEGQNMTIESRWAEDTLERLPDLAAELVRLKLDVIVALGTPAPLAAKQATRTVPIVMTNAGDPMASGLVASLARPGGNITGLSSMAIDLSAKQLELLKEAVPNVSWVAVLWNPANPSQGLMLDQAQATAQRLGLHLQILQARSPTDFGSAFAAMTRERAGALLVLAEPMFFTHRTRLTDFAAKARLPAMYGLREHAEAGGLMAYSANLADLFRRAAVYVDKILKGAKPADLPVEQPTKFDLVINLKTAKALGLTIPQSILIRADQVIQ